jgi:sec-independent protein translocase protein TatA
MIIPGHKALPSLEKELDMIGGIGMPELLVILVIILIIFGAGKLPEIGQGLGRGIKNFRKAASGADEVESKSEKAKIEEKQEEVKDQAN